jgi:hypothetical protein
MELRDKLRLSSHDSVRHDIVLRLLDERDMLATQVEQLKVAHHTQYTIVPNEEPCESTWNHPWHSPRCYEGGAHRDQKLCTCGLTALYVKNNALQKVVDTVQKQLPGYADVRAAIVAMDVILDAVSQD